MSLHARKKVHSARALSVRSRTTGLVCSPGCSMPGAHTSKEATLDDPYSASCKLLLTCLFAEPFRELHPNALS